MRRFFQFAGAIALLLLFMACGAGRDAQPELRSSVPSGAEVTPVVLPVPQLSAPVRVPQVDAKRLVTHLQALQGDRVSPTGRDRTRTYLVNTLEASGWTVTLPAFPGGANVVARSPNAPADAKTVLVVAHFDTVAQSPGADDNGTGVAAALEVARLLRTRSSDKSLAIGLFDLEERGLVGSRAFTANPDNLQNVIGVLNLEMLGYTCNTPGCQTYPDGLPITPPSDRGDFLGIVGDREHDYLLKAFQLAHNQTLPPIITIPIPFKGVLTPDVLRSDHAPFWLNNIGAVMISDTANFRNPHYHQPSDTLDTLDLDFFTRAAQLVVNATTVLLDSQ
jgi:hypothetical protein